jgi:hypothetical protein
VAQPCCQTSWNISHVLFCICPSGSYMWCIFSTCALLRCPLGRHYYCWETLGSKSRGCNRSGTPFFFFFFFFLYQEGHEASLQNIELSDGFYLLLVWSDKLKRELRERNETEARGEEMEQKGEKNLVMNIFIFFFQTHILLILNC